jgi:hypothetical protein
MENTQYSELEKFAEDFVSTMKKALDRDLTIMEKVAVYGFMEKLAIVDAEEVEEGVKGIGKLWQGIKGMFGKGVGMANNAGKAFSEMGGAAKAGWNVAAETPNANLMHKAMGGVMGAFQHNPMLATGTMVGGGMAAGVGMSKMLQPKAPMQAPPSQAMYSPVYASLSAFDNMLEKMATGDYEVKKKSNIVPVALGAAGAGVSAGIGTEALINYYRDKKLSNENKAITETGKAAQGLKKTFQSQRGEQIDNMLSGIDDRKSKKWFSQAIPDIENDIRELKKDVPYTLVDFDNVKNTLKGSLGKNLPNDITPKAVIDHLGDYIDNMYQYKAPRIKVLKSSASLRKKLMRP